MSESKKCLIIVYSYHHENTLKVAQAMAETLGAHVVSPENMEGVEIRDYDLVGFGAGIDSGHHYDPLLTYVEGLAEVKNKECFIFSTSAVQGEKKVWNDHKALRDSLCKRGYTLIGEFSCKGYNTNSFLKYIGGMNKGRPNEKDLSHARKFAERLY